MSNKSSYTQILKSSSIMGGSAGINLLFGMIRTKFAAVMIGTTGIGLLASFTVVQGLISTIVGLGINSSAVREIASAVGKNDEIAVGRMVLTVQRISWLTGLLGMMIMIMFSPLLSQLAFDSKEYTLDIATLGLVVLFTNISGGQMALLQGIRRIGDMARASIIGAVLSTVFAIIFYSWLGLRGIIPSLIIIAAMQLIISWYFARRVPFHRVELNWKETFSEASSMFGLGVVFMWTALMGSIVSYVTITLITQEINIEAVGIYSAAFALSGMFVNFVLQAMGADYYPRLTSHQDNKDLMNRLVNEQIEIGLLLGAPGLLATMVAAPWIIHLFYNSEFLPAVVLIQWFILGSFIRVIQWPMGFLQMALGKSLVYFGTQTLFTFVHIALISLYLKYMGIEGVSVAFFILYIFSFIIIFLVARSLTRYTLSRDVLKLLFILVPIVIITFFICYFYAGTLSIIAGLLLTLITTVLCLRLLVEKLESDHKIIRILSKLPFINWMFSVK